MAVIPFIYYEDPNAAIEWLKQAFGFEEHGEVHRSEDGEIVHAELKLGDAVVMLATADAA